jgi:phosphoglycerate kinase
MAMRSVRDLVPSGELVFCRVDFNVPLEGGCVADDERIVRSLPTLKLLLERGARLVLASHLGRPRGLDDALRLEPVAARAAERLGRPVTALTEIAGPAVERAKAALAPGAALLLENLRFDAGEEGNDPLFAAKLRQGIGAYVNEAFACSHRAHASIVGFAGHVPCYGGLLLAEEAQALGNLRDTPARPFACILGGAKVADKIPLIDALLPRLDILVIGGGMAYTFLAARGVDIGNSRHEPDLVAVAKRYLETAAARGITVVLPLDHVAAPSLAASDSARVVDRLEAGWAGFDIGPRTIEHIQHVLADASTIFWNGPLGVFEHATYAAGTRAIAAYVGRHTAYTVIGGGDSVRAIHEAGVAGAVAQHGHISTGGGASLELLAGDTLPGLSALETSA